MFFYRLLFRIACLPALFIPAKHRRRQYRTWAKVRIMPVIRTQKTHLTKRGNALVCYIRDAGSAPDNCPHFRFHTNYWECREIVRQLLDLGFDVDCIDHDDMRFTPSPKKRYDLVLDTANFLSRFPTLQKASLKIAYMTESYDVFHNNATHQRSETLRQRRGRYLPPDREAQPRLDTYRLADRCIMLGNEVTKATFPEEIHSKIDCLHVTFSELGLEEACAENCFGRDFLFMSGFGAIHKGLDRVLEVFGRHSGWNLHIVGPHLRQKEFVALYEKELLHLPNIHVHGYLSPSSPDFQVIRKQCFAFLLPSCAESMSTAAITAMATGLHPIISRACGVTLPDWVLGTKYLDTCSLEEIEQACAEALAIPIDALREESHRIRHHTQTLYSRQAYSQSLKRLLGDALNNHLQS